MKIDINKALQEDRNMTDPFCWAFFETIASFGKSHPDFVAEFTEKKNANKGAVEVQFIIDGHEMDVQALFKRLDEHMSLGIKKEAVRLLQLRFADVQDSLAKLEKAVVAKTAQELGVVVEEG